MYFFVWSSYYSFLQLLSWLDVKCCKDKYDSNVLFVCLAAVTQDYTFASLLAFVAEDLNVVVV